MSPRFIIHKDHFGSTIAGVPRLAMSWILDAAFVEFHRDLKRLKAKKKPDLEAIALVEGQLNILRLLQGSREEAVYAINHPKGKPPLTKAQRRAIVANERKERELIDSIVVMFAERRDAKPE